MQIVTHAVCVKVTIGFNWLKTRYKVCSIQEANFFTS
jgi:hypothetical protein